VIREIPRLLSDPTCELQLFMVGKMIDFHSTLDYLRSSLEEW